MVRVVGVRFKKAGKIYWFDPGKLEIAKDECVIVETARGIEFGTAVIGVREVSDKEIVQPLKQVIRVATKDDISTHVNNDQRKQEAMDLCNEQILKHKLDMKLIDVEYTFDCSKVIFYFTAEGRVDFRELVKDLASIFRMRIELRQIGVRDEAKMLNGMGDCGVALCCANWLGDFAPVSVKMAKDQNLSLNPTKISGSCGRLMCCLKYEHDTYVQLRRELPNKNEKIKTPVGDAIVMDSDILRESVKVRKIKNSKSMELEDEVLLFKSHEIKRFSRRPIIEDEDDDIIEANLPPELLGD